MKREFWMEQQITIPNLKKLNVDAIIEIDNILSAGYDVELRSNRYGTTVASVSKQVRYKGNENNERSNS